MPFTPYHFGPSAFIGLALKKYIDLPVLVLANVIVDIEVLLFHRWPFHRYTHTLLIGAAVGIAWGTLAYLLKPLWTRIMKTIRLPYQTSLLKMIVSGMLGACLHVIIDSIYHVDIKIFWPSRAKPLFNLLSQAQVKGICIGLLIAAIALYISILVRSVNRKKANQNQTEATK
ncbi:MAG: hypothetical protein ACYS18_08355 [Planctomycetota bacterium]|jgi:membrane-bound metal-dependent hydrolase YbcI (DUF457 family)